MMDYFIDVVNFVDKNVFWVLVAFAAATFIEFIVFLIIKLKTGDHFRTDNFYIVVMTNIVALLALYVLACVCVGFVNCAKAQDWHFWSNYINFIGSKVLGKVLLIAGAIVGAIIAYANSESIILAILGALAGCAIAFVGGLLVYIVVALVIIIIKLIFFVVCGFFMSIFQFIVKYWKGIVFVAVTPGILLGMIGSLINYITSLKEEVFWR